MLERKKQAAAEVLRLPRDAALGEILITMVGRNQVHVENYRSILLYTDQEIKLQGKNCRLHIQGSRLAIEYYTDEDMKITGLIKSVELTA